MTEKPMPQPDTRDAVYQETYGQYQQIARERGDAYALKVAVGDLAKLRATRTPPSGPVVCCARDQSGKAAHAATTPLTQFSPGGDWYPPPGVTRYTLPTAFVVDVLGLSPGECRAYRLGEVPDA